MDWPGEPPPRFFCAQVGTLLREQPEAVVAVVGGPEVSPWSDLLARFLPSLRIVPIRQERDEREVFLELAALGRLDAVVDASDTTAADQAALFCRLVRHLRPGGPYIARLHPGADGLWAMLVQAQTARLRDFPDGDTTDLAWLVRCLASVELRGKVLIARPRWPGMAKLREEDMRQFLARRPEIGAVVHALPPASLVSRCDYDDNAETRDPHLTARFDAPEVQLRRYDGVTCVPRQIVRTEDVLFPDTFRHNTLDRLVNIYLSDYAPRFADPRVRRQEPLELPGAYFYLDSEAPGAFGHWVVEQMSRLWAFDEARRREPGLKLLTSLYLGRTSRRLEPYELDMLASFGIAEEDVVIIERQVRVERLYCATPMYSSPDRGLDEPGRPYVHPEIASVWSRIGDHLMSGTKERPRPRRIFCTRAPGGRRTCRNAAGVEALFEEYGFDIVRPEEHPMPEQVALFRAAEVVAGFAGSSLFTLAFCPQPKRVITVAPATYTGRNEYDISSVWGHRLTSVWSLPEVDHPPGGWTREAFFAPFSFDFSREGRFLRETLEPLSP